MKLSIGIVGLPNVGKSTLFQQLTKREVNVANYPFATIDPNVGVVSVPDNRLERLGQLNADKKIIPAIIEFYDIAGLVKGANKGEGLGNQFLSHIKEVDVILQVVRVFQGGNIVHIEGRADPLSDIETVNKELILKDLEVVEKKLEKTEKEAKGGDQKKIQELEILKKIQRNLLEGNFVKNIDNVDREDDAVKELGFLTVKPQLYLLNGKEEDVTKEIKDEITSFQSYYMAADLEKGENLSELIKQTYNSLNLITFFTLGKEETRAWTIEKEAKILEGAGLIHGDFQEKFVKAEIIDWNKLIEAGSWLEAKSRGWLRLEGKDYTIRDGDVVFIKRG